MWLIVAWIVVFGIIGALLAPRKGYTPGGGFVMCAIFGLIGVAYLALKPDVDRIPDRSGPLVGERRVKEYRPGETKRLQDDVKDAREHGWEVVDREYHEDGSARITFQRRGPSEWAA